MPNKIGTIFLCCLFLFTTNTIASDDQSQFQKAVSQYFQQNFRDALPIFIKYSKQGNAEAHYYLGLIYNDRHFNGYDPKMAIHHLKSAANLNHKQSMFKIGLMYENGEGVEQNALVATDWYRRSKLSDLSVKSKSSNAENIIFYKNKEKIEEVKYSKIFQDLLDGAKNGDSEKQYKIAENYDYGNLIPRDFYKALSWYERSANNNYKPAQFRMGYFYCRGLGVPRDANISNEWLIKSGHNAKCQE